MVRALIHCVSLPVSPLPPFLPLNPSPLRRSEQGNLEADQHDASPDPLCGRLQPQAALLHGQPHQAHLAAREEPPPVQAAAAGCCGALIRSVCCHSLSHPCLWSPLLSLTPRRSPPLPPPPPVPPPSHLPQNEATSREISMVRALIRCVDDCNLKTLFSTDHLTKRIEQLEKNRQLRKQQAQVAKRAAHETRVQQAMAAKRQRLATGPVGGFGGGGGGVMASGSNAVTVANLRAAAAARAVGGARGGGARGSGGDGGFSRWGDTTNMPTDDGVWGADAPDETTWGETPAERDTRLLAEAEQRVAEMEILDSGRLVGVEPVPTASDKESGELVLAPSKYVDVEVVKK
ncbi:unnamed protein product [Closterium sp. NIES-53]